VTLAADWNITGFFSQRLEVSSGDSDDNASGGPGGGATSDLGLTILAETPTTQWRLSPGVRFSYFTNEDTNASDLSSLLPRFDGSVNRRANQRLTLTASAGFTPSRVDSTDLIAFDEPLETPTSPDIDPVDQLRRVDQNALELVYRASVGAIFEVDTRNRLSGTVFARRVDYDNPSDDLVPSTSYGGTASWRRGLSPVTGASGSVNVRQFESEDGETTLTTSVTGGFDTQLTPRHSLSGSIGPAFVLEEREGEESFSVTADSSLSLGYQTAQTRYGLDLRQGVSQQRDGGTVNQLTVGASARHTVNALSSVDFGAGLQFSQQLSGDADDERSYFARASYSRSLSPDWRMQLGYRLVVDNVPDQSVENLVFLQLSRNFELLR
jgi:hypothetical protein